ncbi:MAG: 2-dehydropantoate 2-reductase [Lachnospiraceae bacterium]|nr:2-dehydropantoate 2-reductase [Lachnospiraceae bacterium]
MEIKNVSIIGMGALGLLYADFITTHYPEGKVSFIMDAKRAAKYKKQQFFINKKPVNFNIITLDEAKPADLIFVAVKYTGLKQAIEDMACAVGPNTIIMSVLNGISSEELLAKKYPVENIVYTVAQGMDAMKFGNSLDFTQMGRLHFGMTDKTSPEAVNSVKTFFEKIGMPHVYEEDILWRMWFKFMLNVGVNQTCMLYNTTYHGVLTKGEPNRTLVGAMREVETIANAKGIKLTEADLNKCIEIESTLDPNGTPSMGQDRINKKASEVEMFAGKIIELGKELNILVPVNEFIYEGVKEIEKEYV